MDRCWSDYWQDSAKTSFDIEPTNSFLQVLDSEWANLISNIERPNRILDIGTGGGALIRLGLKHQKVKHSYIGIDYAKLNLADDITQDKCVQIIENENVETLTLTESSIDLAISQFAIEYSNLKLSIKEIARVLKINGKFTFICHCSDSEIIRRNSDILNTLNKVLEANGVLDNVQNLLIALGRSPDNISLLKTLQIKLKENLTSVQARYPDTINDINLPLFIQKIFSREIVTKPDELFQSYLIEINSYSQRLSALIDSALDKNRILNFKNICKYERLDIEEPKFIYKDNLLLGVILKAKKY